MSRPTSPAKILRSAAGAGITPFDAEISSKGEARWEADGLSTVAWPAKDASGVLLWHVNAGDAELGPALERFGGLSIRIRPAGGGAMAWPTSFGEHEATGTRSTLGEGARFVEGRRDLCELLAARSDVVRGSVRAWLPIANYPARLVQALIVSRDVGHSAMEAIVLERLKGAPVDLANGRTMDIMASAKEWAKRYSKALGADVPL